MRIWLYKSAWSGFLEAPITGHGIGNLSSVWKSKPGYSEQLNNKPDLMAKLVHPHNELLFWMNNSGIITLVAFLAIGSLFLFSAFTVYGYKAFEILGLMSPFLISAMVSRPFELSPIIFLLLLFFIHYGLRNKRINFNKSMKFEWRSELPKKAGFIFATFIIIILNFSAWFTLTSNREVAEFQFYRDNHPGKNLFPIDSTIEKPFLEHAKYHPFFEYKAMNAMLVLSEEAFKKGYTYDLLQYVHWANSRKEYLESPAIVFNLLKSYLMLKKNNEAITLYNKTKVQFSFNKNFQTIGKWMAQKGLIEKP